MKKFIVLSSLIAIAGVTIGLINRSGSDTQTIEAAAATSTTVTTATVEAITVPTTTPKTAPKATTVTTVRRVITPTTVPTLATTAPTRPITTTTTAAAPTTTTTVAAVTPACTATASNPSVHKGDSQTISVVSNMPSTKTRLTIQYPKFDTGKPNPRLEYTLTTDADGNLSKTFTVSETSTVPVAVSAQFYDAAGHLVQGCQTTFEST